MATVALERKKYNEYYCYGRRSNCPKKVAFADRKNANLNRIEQDEKEPQELMQTKKRLMKKKNQR